MFYSAIAFILTLLMAFTIIPMLAFLIRMILVIISTRIYWSLTTDTSPANILKFTIKITQPFGFLTAIFHGYTALWMGVVLLKGMGQTPDLFLSSFLAFCFFWFGIKRIQNPADIEVSENENVDENGKAILVLNPEVESIPEDGENPMNSLNEQLKNKLKEQSREFLQGNTIVGLIGKVTGVALATMSMIPLS